MKIILNNIKMPIKHQKEDVYRSADETLRKCSIKGENIRIYRESIDARRKTNIHYVYAVTAETDLTKREIEGLEDPEIRICEEAELNIKKQQKFSNKKVIVVGTGPCGLFAAFIMAKAGLSPLVIERGADVDERTKIVQDFWNGSRLNLNTNVQFGEGGAGTFSDGKLTTRIGDPLQRIVLETFVKFGAPEDILYKAKPHIGTDKLKMVVKNMRKEIERLGGTVKFNAVLTDVVVTNNVVTGAVVNGEEVECNKIILATGHSSRDTYEMLYKKGVSLIAKPFAAGVRIEHKQSFINKMQYGEEYQNPNLPPADYRLVYNGKDRSCYSFCMCPGGTVVNASSEDGCLVVNGMSEYARNNENANSALVVSVKPSDFSSDSPLSGIEFQRKYEGLAYMSGGNNFSAPVQLAKDFVGGKISSSFENVIPSFTGKTVFADLRECLPDFISGTLKEGLLDFEKRVKGYITEGAVLTGVEMRTSAPVRILRNKNYESINLKGLYPAGEGAGYAGGIMSAAVDGIKIALNLLK